MDYGDIASCDALRAPDKALVADERMEPFVILSKDGVRRVSLAERHAEISRYELSKEVPLDVRVHFENARNLYLYAWFVYRFHAVSEEHALGSLEYALRLRLIDGAFVSAAKGDKMGLSDLLKRAKKHDLIRNGEIKSRVMWATELARDRHSLLQIDAMSRAGLTEMVIDDSNVTPTDDDLACDWISVFVESLPTIRNDYAHGSQTLRPTVLRTFDIVCDLINQLFTKQLHKGAVTDIGSEL